MPKELRKRGKRAKKNKEEDAYIVYAKPDEKAQHLAAVTGTEYTGEEQQQADTSGYPASRLAATSQDVGQGYNDSQHGAFAAASLGQQEESTSLWPAVDPDMKAYFKQLENQIFEFEQLHGARLAKQAEEGYAQGEEEEEELDQRVLLLRAALTQLTNNEASIAADPETSPILERLVYSMDDFARRVLIDRFTGQYSDIAQDRFASHVLQTLIVLGGGETVERERRGVIAIGPINMGQASTSTSTTAGELPTMTECIVALAKEVLEDLPRLVKSQTGSYIVRAILLVLAGKPLPFDSQSTHAGKGQSAISRSKKSARWKNNRQGGEMRSFLPTNEENSANTYNQANKGKAPEKRIVPKIFEDTLEELLVALDRTLSGSKSVNSEAAQQNLRIASDDPIATGLVQIMLEIENDQSRSEKQGSLMDRLLQGLITAHLNNTLPQQPPRSDYIETLLRSNISSHVLEKLISLCPPSIYDLLFKVYFVGRMGRLAGHPVANFVCARVVERANTEQTQIVVDEIPDALEGIIENSRTGVLKALLDKVALYNIGEEALNKALLDAFQTTSEEDIQYLIPCALSLMSLRLFKRNPSFVDPTAKAEMQVQGSLILQSWLRIKNNAVTQSLLAMPIPRLIVLASDPMASRVIDAFLDEDNKAVPYKDRRNFLRNLIGHYGSLADDRIGSRVAERCWAVADPFLRDKIAESLIQDEIKLQGSFFGHFFIRKVNLPLYKRNRYDWKDRQARGIGGTPAELHAQQQQAIPAHRLAAQAAAPVREGPAAPTENAGTDEQPSKKKRKNKSGEADEIDQIFGGAVKKGKLSSGIIA